MLLAFLGMIASVVVRMANRQDWHRENEREFRMSEEVRGRANMTAFLAQAMRSTREELAELAHQEWAGWVDYMFSKGTFNIDGTFTIPADLVDRWQRQRQTPYQELSETEKESDRIEADRVIALWCEVPFGGEET